MTFGMAYPSTKAGGTFSQRPTRSERPTSGPFTRRTRRRPTAPWPPSGRGARPQAADLLQALNTGHGGSLTTIHANNAESALSRLASCAMQGGGDLPWEVICRSVVDGIAIVIHQTRRDGRRYVEEALMVGDYDIAKRRWHYRPVAFPSSPATLREVKP